MRYLVTGGAGFIGSHLVDCLVDRGDEVMVLDDLSTGSRENLEHQPPEAPIEFVEGSTTDSDLVGELMREADRCFHLASAVGVKLVVEQPLASLLRNARGCDVVTAAAARTGTRLLFTSTSEIYGKDSTGALAEDSDRRLGPPTTSRWLYANTKVYGEMLAYAYHREMGAENVVVRLFNTVGPRQSGAYGMALPTFAAQALIGDPLTVYGDGMQSRCFAHVYDSLDAILRLMDADAATGNVYNVGSSLELTILDLATRVIERASSSSQVKLVRFEDAYDDGFEELGRRRPDTRAVQMLTGWSPKRSIEQTIDDVLAHQRRRVGMPASA